ncbi:MAG: hypothetical protein L0Y66_24850 [Myxococcaceae bacterium]|nr:hypothetical protein [Myxococcaceae bacterium]MCI0669241.1 hypothetical protein [Myxococcaceae bacterium]
MLAVSEHATFEEAGQALLPFALQPTNWVSTGLGQSLDEALVPAAYQRQVGGVRICAAVRVSPRLEAELQVLFRGPGLTLLKAAELLERFLRLHLPLSPNTEWRVVTDGRKGVRFSRRWASTGLQA